MKRDRYRSSVITKKEKAFLLFLACCLILFVMFSNRLRIIATITKNQLAQIIAIETDLLKKWSQGGGLKSNLTLHSQGKEVYLLQSMLMQDSELYLGKKATGYFGKLTQQAVIQFQKEYGITETGWVDEDTRKKLNKIFFNRLCPTPTVEHPDFLMETVSHEYALPADFVPDNLVDISDEVKTNGIACLSAEVVPVLKEMFAAAKEDGVDLMVTSAYRSPEIQEYLYNFWIHVDGEKAYKEVAKPGHSEHQLGTTVDLTDVSIGYAGVSPLFEVSDGGLWLQSNAHKYGFIMSYPKVNEKTQAYSFEPWHWRYVGTYTAEKMQKERLKHEN